MMNQAIRISIVFFMLCLTGCGTNIFALLETDSELAWQAEEVARTAENRNITTTNGYYDAETEKLHVCQPLYRNADSQIELGMRGRVAPVFERFWGDLLVLGALLVPVPQVEDCARAIERYEFEYFALSDRLGGLEGRGDE